eukprot:1161463-Pelagomonas_calceolata.AAC.4
MPNHGVIDCGLDRESVRVTTPPIREGAHNFPVLPGVSQHRYRCARLLHPALKAAPGSTTFARVAPLSPWWPCNAHARTPAALHEMTGTVLSGCALHGTHCTVSPLVALHLLPTLAPCTR